MTLEQVTVSNFNWSALVIHNAKEHLSTVHEVKMDSNEVSLQIYLCLVIDVSLLDVGLAVVRRTYVIVHITLKKLYFLADKLLSLLKYCTDPDRLWSVHNCPVQNC